MHWSAYRGEDNHDSVAFYGYAVVFSRAIIAPFFASLVPPGAPLIASFMPPRAPLVTPFHADSLCFGI